jgi:ribosomal protein S18 acetylase RimI-like enzyme
MAIRRAELPDLSACARLYVEVCDADFHWRPAGFFRAQEFLGYAEHEELWVAEPDGAIAGFLSYFAPEHFLHSLYVRRDARGQGIGAALIAHARAHYGVPHSLKVDVPNEAARRFYERLGYAEIRSGATDGVDWIELRSA